MIKIIPANAWNLPMSPVQLVKVARSGFKGDDYTQLVKRSGHPLANWVRNNPPLPGEMYVHQIALGASEKYAGNRNADRYSERMLISDTPSFKKYARAYREHLNTNPDKSYGVVKEAFYDPEVKRTELIVALNTNKEAADRNKGLIADLELDDLEKYGEYAVSQSCRVPRDTCMACNNSARHRGEYCGPSQCTKYGGCRDNLGKSYEDGFRLEVDNPKCQFFDISRVRRGADPTAFCTGKVANNYILGGAELAELLSVTMPEHAAPTYVISGIEGLKKVANRIKYLTDDLKLNMSWSDILQERSGSSNTLEFDGSLFERHIKLSSLSKAGVLLPPAIWLNACLGIPVEKCASIFSNVDLNPNLLLTNSNRCSLISEAILDSDMYMDHTKYACYTPSEKSEVSLAIKYACGFNKQANTRCIESQILNKSVEEELNRRYNSYIAASIGMNVGTNKEAFVVKDAARYITNKTW